MNGCKNRELLSSEQLNIIKKIDFYENRNSRVLRSE